MISSLSVILKFLSLDDILCKRIYEKDRKLRGQSEQEKARLQRIQNNDKDEAIFSLLSTI